MIDDTLARQAMFGLPHTQPFGLKALQQAAPDKGAQDAPAQGGLNLCDDCLVDSADRVKDHARRCGLKHAIDHADVQVHMLVQAGAEPVNEGYGTNVQCGLVQPRRTRAVGLQALRNDSQENAQQRT